MRRTATTGPLSPKLIKHFAMATVALTGLLAVFASGEDWGPQAQVKAVEAKNQLLTTEAEKLGTRKLAAKLKVREGRAAAAFADEAGSEFGGGDAPQYILRQPVTGDGVPAPAGEAQLKDAKARGRSAPTAQEIADITANSARRSGQAGESD